MAKTITTGPTDTTVAGAQSLTIPVALNYGTDYRVLAKEPGNVVAINVTPVLDQPETLRFASRKVSNIYAGTDIDPSAFLPTRAGQDVLVQLRQTWAETDSGDVSYRKLIPMTANITLRVPSYANVTSDMVAAFAKRAFVALFEQGLNDSSGLNALMRGVLQKKDMKG